MVKSDEKECPYCGHVGVPPNYQFGLSRKRRDVFNAIVAAGPEGVDSTDLVDMFFDDGTDERIAGYTTLRTTIHAINQKIGNLTIVARGGNYRLERRD
jgi:hypothetical protein